MIMLKRKTTVPCFSVFVTLLLFFSSRSLYASLTYSFDLPLLGKAELIGDIDFLAETFSLRGTLVGKETTLAVGPCSLDRPTITLSNTKGLQLTARAQLFDEPLEVGIKEFKEKNKITLGASFVKKPSFTFFEKKIELSDIDIILEEGKTPRITTTIELLGSQANLTFGADNQTQYIEINAPNLNLQKLLPESEKKLLERFTFDTFAFKLINPFKKEGTQLEIQGKGSVRIDETISYPLNYQGSFSKNGFALQGKVLTAQSYYPFRDTYKLEQAIVQLPALSTLALSNLSIGIENKSSVSSKQALFIEGECELFNKKKFKARLNFIQNDAGKKGVSLHVNVPQKMKISRSIPSLTSLDFLTFEHATLIISTLSYFDTQANIPIEKGFSLLASLSINDVLPTATPLLGGQTTALLYGTLNADGALSLKASLPFALRFGKGPFKSAETSLLVELSKESLPSIALQASITVQPTDRDMPLVFSSEIKPGAADAKISGTMQGLWNAPFGIEGFSIGDCALSMSINYAQFAVSGLPSGAAIAASMKLGTEKKSKTMAIALSISENPSDLVLLGKVDGKLTFREIVEFAKTIALTKSKNSSESFDENTPIKVEQSFEQIVKNPDNQLLLDSVISNVEMKIVPTSTTIGQLRYQRGATFKGDATFLGKTVHIALSIDEEGVRAEGKIPSIIIGDIFSFSGPEEKEPTLTIALTPSKQQCEIEGLITFLGVSRKAILHASSKGFLAQFDTTLFKAFEASATLASLGSLSKPNFSIKLRLKNDALSLLSKKISDSIRSKFENAIAQLDSLEKNNETLEALTSSIHQLEIDRATLERDDPRNPALIGTKIELSNTKARYFIVKKATESAEKILNELKKILGLSNNFTIRLIEKTKTFFMLTSCEIETTIADLMKGILPAAKLNVDIFGQPKELTLQVDLRSQKDMEISLQKMALDSIALLKL